MTKKLEKPSPADKDAPRRFVPNFIIDAPATADELNGRARLAETIADTLIGNQNIKFVGILGEWGSGKSSVVRLLEQKLEESKDPQILCFNYDAWLHQSDPPKRSFLEALLRFVREDKRLKDVNLDDEKWDKDLKALNGQVETSEVFTQPQLAVSAKVILPAVVFVPLGVKLLGDGVLGQSALRDPWSVALFATGWVLALGPAILAAVIYLIWRPWKRPGPVVLSRAFWSRHKPGREQEAILAVFSNKPTEFKVEQKSKGPEPSTIEFQDMFRKIVAAVQTDKRRLAIVIDNLDRIPSTERLALWSTIRSFFLGSDHAGQPLKRGALPAVVLPVDTEALDRLSGMDNAGQAFSDKTFDLVFNVPPPVFSKWQAYLQKQLKAVFGKHLDPQWLHDIVMLYEWAAKRAPTKDNADGVIETPRITPRSINVFVNTIAASWMRWRGENVSLPAIAYFVLARLEREVSVREAFKDNSSPIESFDEDWRRAVAALYYGVSKQEADELFMEQPLREALRNNQADEFQVLSTLPGFDRYLLDVLKGPEGYNDGIDPQVAALLLQALSQTNERSAWRRAAWAHLRQALPTFIDDYPVNERGISIIFNNISDFEKSLFLGRLSNSVLSISKSKSFEAIDNVIKLIMWLKLAHEESRMSMRPIDIDDAGVVVGLLSSKLFEKFRLNFNFKNPGEGVSNYILKTINYNMDVVDPFNLFKNAYNKWGDDFDSDILRAHIIEVFDGVDYRKISICLELLWSLRVFDDEAKIFAQNLARGGMLRAVLERSWAGGRPDAFHMGLALVLSLEGGLPRLDWAKAFDREPELGAKVAEHLSKLDEMSVTNFLVHRPYFETAGLLLRATFTAWAETHAFTQAERDELLNDSALYDRLLEDGARAKFWDRIKSEADGA